MTFKSEIIFVRVLAAFAAGIVGLFLIANPNLVNPILIINVFLFTILLIINIWYKKIKAYRYKNILASIFYLFFFAFGGLITLLYHQSFKADYYAKAKYNYLKVWVNDEPQLKNNILRFEVNVIEGFNGNKVNSVSGKLLIALKVDSLNPVKLNYGDELIITSKYLPVEPAYN
ncbi:MAG: DUF4131 domain-containing protein, partial [Pedobacter sp.]